MSEMATWQANNNRYLSASLTWLRLRLLRLAGASEIGNGASVAAPPGHAPLQPVQVNAPRGRFGIKPAPVPAAPVANHNASHATTAQVQDSDVERARLEMEEFARIDPQPTLMELARIFGLSLFEQQVLLLCAGMELDTRIANLCALAGDDRPFPTFALALTLFEDAAWDALSPERALRYWRLVEINQPGAQPLTASALRIDERILNYIKGLNYVDDRLSPLLTRIDAPAETGDGVGATRRVAPTDGDDDPSTLVGATHASPLQENDAVSVDSQTAAVNEVVERLETVVSMGRLPLVHLLGADTMSKQVIAARVANHLGLQVYRVPSELLPTTSAEMESFARLWQRETALVPVALYIDAYERGEGQGHSSLLTHLLSRNRGLVFLDTRDVSPDITPLAVSLDVAKPPAEEQRAAWTAALGSMIDSQTPALLASQFNLNLTTIHQVAQESVSRSATPGRDLQSVLWKACLVSTRPRLDLLAQRIDAKATWNDIVLPEQERLLVRHIVEQVRQRAKVYEEWGFRRRMNRGLGISVLCAGESGTGKTMAAEVIANDLQLDLYRIDLSAVVSKYIGETEKNLRRLFDAAEDGGAVLFFDEADALFGKRSEVKDSHDRYANIEINYLLQRIEAYRGLALLATNMKTTLDTAFMRRLRFVINFPFPGLPERKLIWEKVFPVDTPTGKLDYDRLARLNLSGGNIHSIALNAAFLAAAQHSSVTMPLILQAARIEYLKLERPINETDFL